MPNGFLSDDQGNRSSGRLMFVGSFAASIIFGFIAIFTNNDTAMYLSLGFMANSGLPKSIQKFAENGKSK